MNPKELTNEELASIIRAMIITGITKNEKAYLEEAAARLEALDEQ